MSDLQSQLARAAKLYEKIGWHDMSLPESYKVQDGCWNCKYKRDDDTGGDDEPPVIESGHDCEYHEKEEEG